MPSIRYIHGRRPHIATGSVDSSSDDSHFIDYAHPASQHSKDLPTLFDQDIWQGDTDTDTYTQVAPFPSSPPSSASGASASGATLSSPVLEPRYKDIQDQRDSVRLWDLADKIFGDLLDSIDFPLIYDRHIRRHHITEQDWQETKTYLEQHTYIVHSLSFFYDPVMATLDIYSPTSLHQIVNDSMVNRYTESVQVKQHQAISIDGARGLITDNIGHTPDSVLSISTTRRLPDGDLIYVARDTGVTETSFTQSVDDMVGQMGVSMGVSDRPIPLLFTGINIDTEDFIEPDAEHAAPDSGGFIKGGGAANDVISTGWKRGDRVLIKRVKAQWFMFLPEEREDVARCLKEYHNARDWVVWKYGVPIQHHYEAGSEAFIAHDHALRRYREAIIRIRAVAHNQRVLAILMEAEQTRDKSVLNELKESDVADDLTFDDPPIPDPIPSFIRDIQVGVRQKAQDDWSRHTYRVETNNAATLNDAEERSQYRRVMETLKRVLDDDVADGDEQALADFRKRQRFNTPSPPPPPKPRQPPRLKVEDFPEEELSSSEPSGSGSSAKSSFEQPRGMADANEVAKRTFLDWISQGSKFAFAAGGGSVYMLILIAVQNLRVPLGAVDGHSAQEIGNMLRWPDDSRAGHLVKEIIIPSISNLHRHYPTMLDDLFPVSTVRIGSLEENDAYFDGLKSNTFSLVPRLKSVWQSYGQGVLRAASPIQQPSRLSPLSQSLNPLSLSPLTPVMTLSQLSSQLSSPLSSQLSSPLSSPHWLPHSSPQSTFEATVPTPPIPVIITSYDPEKKNNLRYPAPRDKAQNIAWTETARSWARKAIVPVSIEDLQSQLQERTRMGRELAKMHLFVFP
ncbi:uncharacterized protein B0H18DRAFT_1130110 [Fomitopsis serialis]|uniref:uncharacterized protein n=1 Tax=Fomitopsis serialis TaxID=139415 RepID=UPI002007AE74|nr:uncharacterized protein B0H18DRAFT_1130110 [Neoantrodia serialis]KAH9910448.1 hypothetical protein B0H18DRAFT_1130110 [Neoantrodia serialis]